MVSIVLYAVVTNFHFLAAGHTLRDEHGAVYQRVGRFVLAAMSLPGWGMGLLFAPRRKRTADASRSCQGG